MDSEKFVLGRKCVFRVDGLRLQGVRDVGVRRTTTEVDGTGFGHSLRSSVVTHRTYEIDVEVLSHSDVLALRRAELSNTPVTVDTFNGLVPVSGRFTVHEVVADENLDEAVIARFSLRQWGH